MFPLWSRFAVADRRQPPEDVTLDEYISLQAKVTKLQQENSGLVDTIKELQADNDWFRNERYEIKKEVNRKSSILGKVNAEHRRAQERNQHATEVLQARADGCEGYKAATHALQELKEVHKKAATESVKRDRSPSVERRSIRPRDSQPRSNWREHSRQPREDDRWENREAPAASGSRLRSAVHRPFDEGRDSDHTNN